MRIDACFYYPRNDFHKARKAFYNKNFSQINFEAKPHKLPKIAINTVYDAILLYGFLSCGNFLDSSDDDVFPQNKKIRDENLNFLDKLTSDNDKRAFIEHYKEVTGFPNLELVSKKIEKEFILGIKKSSIGIEGAECLAAGYDGTCSVGKGKAFPGSDLDKSFIILKGTGNIYQDESVLNSFKHNLWNNIDQRLLSFNHDISFPSVYTIAQITDKMEKINNKTCYLPIDKSRLNYLIDEEYKNIETAAEYNIQISKQFDVTSNNNFELTKEDVKNMAYLIESIRDGKYLITSYEIENFKNKYKNTSFYKYSNVAQMTAMKKAVEEGRENKSKIILRQNMEQDFTNWNLNKQFEFIKTLIKYSCEDNEKFREYFSNDRTVKDAYKPLLNILTQGNRNLYNRLEFEQIDNGLKVIYAENKSVNIYPGFSDNVLWIDSNDETAIRQVLRFIEKIKQNDLFAKIDRIQCVQSEYPILGFYSINFTTIDGKYIMEKML